MTPAERELALQNLAESRERLLRMAHGLSREQLHYRPAPGRWTVAECLEHIVTVETRLLDRIQTTLGKGPDSSRRSVFEGQDAALVARTIGRVQRFPAPEILVPTGRVPDEQLLPAFEAARERSRDFAASTQADLRSHYFKHPIFGDLDLYQWLLMIAAHCDRHHVQSEEVIASEGFPTAKKANAPA
jgi:uncharacterized damage-inducible protein DinB